MRPVRMRTTSLQHRCDFVSGDPVGIGQDVLTGGGGDVEQDAAGDHRRELFGAVLQPVAAAEVAVRPDLVPHLPVEAEVVERVKVGARMGVHRDAVT
jgi:hypothetical protein